MNTNSQLAHAEVPNFRLTHFDKIEMALKLLKKESTYSEIARCIGWYNSNKVSRRMPELVGLKRVVKCESRICTVAKTMCSTYKIA